MTDMPPVVFRPAMPLDEVACVRHDRSLAAAEAMVRRWCATMMIDRPQRTADFEDWHENAAVFFAAIDAGAPVMVTDPGRRRDIRPTRFFNGAPAHLEDITGAVEIGKIALIRPDQPKPLWPTLEAIRAANGYADNPAFARHAGRTVAVAYSDGDADDDMSFGPLVRSVQDVARRAGPELMIKNVTAGKSGPVEPMTVADPADAASIAATLMALFEYDLIHNDAGRPRFLVQERIEIAAEYRVAVVDDQPRAGAGCIESFCPPYNPERLAFHPAVEGRRGDGVIVERPDLVAVYVERAAEICLDLCRSEPAACDIIIDLGVKPNGEIIMIEANPLTRFGLYAMDYQRVIAPLLQRLSPTPVMAPWR